jgi:hypothetical protein
MRTLFYLFIVVLTTSCGNTKNSDKKVNELYTITDAYVDSLTETYYSYGVLIHKENVKYTSDGLYKISSIGRLINVRIEKFVDDRVYDSLKNEFLSHYKNSDNVNGVYICNGGTIMIDCRSKL